MPPEAVTQFPYDEIDEHLLAESVSKQRLAAAATENAHAMAATALRELIRWIVVGDAQERHEMQVHKRPSGRKIKNGSKSIATHKTRFCALRIGRRAIAAAWMLDAQLMGGMSLAELSRLPETRSTVSVLSSYGVEFKHKFGIHAAGQSSDVTSRRRAKALTGNKSAKRPDAIDWSNGK